MLKLSPILVIECSEKLKEISSEIYYNVDNLQKIYETFYYKIKNKKELDTKVLTETTNLITEEAIYMQLLVEQLEEATGESADQLLKANYDFSYYEEKLIDHYAKIYTDSKDDGKIDSRCHFLECFYDFWYPDGSMNIKLDVAIKNYCIDSMCSYYLSNFEFEKFGLTYDGVVEDLIYIWYRSGSSEVSCVIDALTNNCPDNFFDYDFNPQSQTKQDSYYDYGETIGDYQTNSEIIEISGYEFDIAQVLPGDCTKVERLLYDFCKANVINTMTSLPKNYIKTGSQGASNAIVLTFSRNAMGYVGNWGGYYSYGDDNTNQVVIDAYGSFRHNEYYTEDVVIHELGHKFDDMIYIDMWNNDGLIDRVFGRESYYRSYYTDDDEWNNYYEKYKDVLPEIVPDGYNPIPDTQEFFAEMTVAYFKNSEELREQCPDAYYAFQQLLEPEPTPAPNSSPLPQFTPKPPSF